MPEGQPNSPESSLDCNWIREILIKRTSNYSSVACIATFDPIRPLQLRAYLATCGDYANSQIYSFNPWRGLEYLNTGDEGYLYPEPVSQQAGEYAQMAGVENQIIDLNTALRHMDRVLREHRSVFIMEYLDSPRNEEKERHLLNALRDWAHDPDIIYQGSIVILLVGSYSKVLDEFTKQHTVQIQPPIASREERARTIDDIGGESSLDITETKEALVVATAGLNLHQLESTLREAYHRYGELTVESIRDLKNDFIKMSELLQVAEPAPEGFAAIGGYQAVKNFVDKKIVQKLKNPARVRRLTARLPRGFILFGPPGTGKSLFARSLAGEVNLPIINLRTEKLMSKYLGESGHNFDKAISIIEQMSPVIVFIDEIDKLLRERTGGTDGASNETRNVLNQVLEWLGSKGRKSVLVGATNRPEDLDRAAIRAGRIDYMIPMLYPDAEARCQILEVHLGLRGNVEPVPVAMGHDDLESLIKYLAEQTAGFSGAELEQLVNEIKDNAFDSEAEALSQDNFAKAIEGFRINQTKRSTEEKHYLRLADEFTSHSAFFGGLQ